MVCFPLHFGSAEKGCNSAPEFFGTPLALPWHSLANAMKDDQEMLSDSTGGSLVALEPSSLSKAFQGLHERISELQKTMENRFEEVTLKLTQPDVMQRSQDTNLRDSVLPRREFQSGISDFNDFPVPKRSIQSTHRSTVRSTIRSTMRSTRGRASFNPRSTTGSRMTLASVASRASSKMSNVSEAAMVAFGGNKNSLIWDATRSQRKAAEKTASIVSIERNRSRELREKQTHWIRHLAGRMVDSLLVSQGVMLLVFLHVIMLAIEVDRSASSIEGQDLPGWFMVLNGIIVCIFVLEILMKFVHLGCSNFWCGLDSKWNTFDLLIVIVSVADVAMEFWSEYFSDSNELHNFLESMGISTADVWTLFALLDTEEEGVMDLDAFISGCMQMYGNAKSMQMAKLSYENVLLRRAVSDFRDETMQEISALREILAPRRDTRRDTDSGFRAQFMEPLMEDGEEVMKTVTEEGQEFMQPEMEVGEEFMRPVMKEEERTVRRKDVL